MLSFEIKSAAGIPGWIKAHALAGQALAREHAQARGEDATFGEIAQWTFAHSALASARFGHGAEADLRVVARDGADLGAPDIRKRTDALGRIARACDAMGRVRQASMQARRDEARAEDALLGSAQGVQYAGRPVEARVHGIPWDVIAPPHSDPPELGKSTWTRQKLRGTGEAALGNNLQAVQNRAEIDLEEYSAPINCFLVETATDPLALAQASHSGIALAQGQERAALRALNKAIGNLVYNGSTNFNYEGILNFTGMTPTEGSATAIGTETVDNVVKGIVSIMTAYYANAGDHFPPQVIQVAQTVYSKLQNPLSSQAISGLAYLEQTLGVRLSSAIYLNSRTIDSATKHGVVIANNGPDGLATAIAPAPLVFAYQDGMQDKVLYVQPFAGASVGELSALHVGYFAV